MASSLVLLPGLLLLLRIQDGKQVPSLVSTRDDARHAAVLSYEEGVDETIEELCGCWCASVPVVVAVRRRRRKGPRAKAGRSTSRRRCCTRRSMPRDGSCLGR